MAGKGSRGGKGGGPAGRVVAHILIIEARYYEDVADELAAGAVAELTARGATYERIAVPGALEIPQVLALAFNKEFEDFLDDTASPFDGAIALGCVIRGETSHYDVVCGNTNHWLMHHATINATPVGNAILTVDSKEQAMTRAKGGRDGKGGDAARACLRLVEIARRFREVDEE